MLFNQTNDTQNTIETIIISLVSLVIAFFTFWFVQHNHILSNIQYYFFGNATDFGQLSHVGKSFWASIKTLMILMVFFVIIYSFFFLLFLEALAIVYFIFSSKWFKPRVFISYKMSEKGANVNTNKIALDIKKYLNEHGFNVLHFQFEKKPDHDAVNFQINKLLQKAQAMIVVPDAYEASYVDAEISCAVNKQIPVYIIKHTDDQKLPSTANSGHTVLLLKELKKEKYKPLNYILQYSHQLWHKRLSIIGIPLIGFALPFIYFEDEDSKLIIALGSLAIVTAGLVYFKIDLQVVMFILKLIVTLLLALSAYITISEIRTRIQFQRVIKQSMIHAGNTYDYFVAAGFDKDILKCIDEVGLLK